MRCVIPRLPSSTNLTRIQLYPNNVCFHHAEHKEYLRRSGHLRSDGDRLSVKFSSNPNAQYSNRELLAIHAVCARATYMSSTAEACDGLERDV